MILPLSSLMSLICLVDGNAKEVLPKATLTTKTTIIPLKGNATLTCSVQGYKNLEYMWFHRSSATSDYQPLLGYEAATATVSSGGDYTCQGRSTNSSSPQSDPVTMVKTVSSGITVRRQPKWTPLFSGERVALSCHILRGEAAQWTYQWKTPGFKKRTGYAFTIASVTTSHSGDYRCRARRGYIQTTWSRAFKVDVSSNKPRASLRADSTEGANVTLTCSVSESEGWDRFLFMYSPSPSEFYPLETNKSSTLSVSKGGVYVCRGERGSQGYQSDSSPAVTVRKTVLGRNESSLPVVLVVGLVCLFTIILLLPLCWVKHFKESCCSRSVHSSPSVDETPTIQSTGNQSEAPAYASLSYDRPTNEYGNITTLQGLWDDNTKGSSDYINVNPYEATGVKRCPSIGNE
ncbi:uncharacterized protein LOC114847839 isoform X2 [Betta splendens]|uniref:Uncharacterized protein LOC114847839 isoform X2 n=1 Tax=Betta splendens TaxID=158456 RepID=A0A9W2XMI4_BETSP|nr:uncharacterized protein LOC114847839 isoform X2 [Betta splendens]